VEAPVLEEPSDSQGGLSDEAITGVVFGVLLLGTVLMKSGSAMPELILETIKLLPL